MLIKSSTDPGKAIPPELEPGQKFCSFCLVEGHVKAVLEAKRQGKMKLHPLGIHLLFRSIGGGGLFEIGLQCDAAEFLQILLQDMIQASFGYLKNVPFSYENSHLTFIPQVFQGLLER